MKISPEPSLPVFWLFVCEYLSKRESKCQKHIFGLKRGQKINKVVFFVCLTLNLIIHLLCFHTYLKTQIFVFNRFLVVGVLNNLFWWHKQGISFGTQKESTVRKSSIISQLLNCIKVRVSFGKNIEKKHLCCHDQNYYYFWKSNIPKN